MVIQFLIVWGTSILFSAMVAPIDIITNIIKEFSKCLHLIIFLCPGEGARQSTFQMIVVVKPLNIRSTHLNISCFLSSMSHLVWHYYHYCSGYVLQYNSWTWESLLMLHTFHSNENKKGIKSTRSEEASRSERVSFRPTQIKGLWPSLSLKQPWKSLSHH